MQGVDYPLSSVVQMVLDSFADVVAHHLLIAVACVAALSALVFLMVSFCEARETRRAKKLLRGEQPCSQRELERLIHDLADSTDKAQRALAERLKHVSPSGNAR